MNNKPHLDPREVRWTTPVLTLVGEHSLSRDAVVYGLNLRYGTLSWTTEIRAERDPDHPGHWRCPADKLALAINKLAERLEQQAVDEESEHRRAERRTR